MVMCGSSNVLYCQCVYVPKYFDYVINNFQNKEFFQKIGGDIFAYYAW